MTHQDTDALELYAELNLERPMLKASPPKTLAEVAKLASVIGERRARPLPHARQYIHITARRDVTKGRFNTIPTPVTESVEIAGVKLIWSTLDRDGPLAALHKRRDLRNLTIYADQVIFRSSFEFPGTNVTIFARELAFEDDGSIDTRPQAQTQKPFTPRDKDGYPPDYKVADGLPGEPGGSVTLNVGRIRVEGDQKKKRIKCGGSRGQDGEDGGWKRYAPGGGDIKQPAAGNDKNVPAVSLQTLKDRLKDLHHVPDNFHYPGYPEGNIVSAKVLTWAPVFPWPNLEQYFFPGPNELFMADMETLTKIDLSYNWAKKHGIRPGKGEDAYPSGTPGRGGDGGAVTIDYEGPELDVPALLENEGGEAGTSIKIDGKPPGGPSPAYHAIAMFVRSDADGSGVYKKRPFLMQQEVTNTEWGKSEPAPTAKKGDAGARSVTRSGKRRWLHPLVVAGVLHYARDAFRNGYREDARDILEPYRQALANAQNLDNELKPKRTAVLAMASNLSNNLDYFGNRIGWVPRLHVTTNFKLFERERVNASRLLYFSQTLAEKWDTLKHASDAASQTAGELEAELESAQAALVEAFDEFDAAKKKLDAIDDDLKAAKSKFERVYERATNLAKGHVETENLVKGMCKLVGGLAKVVPIGQPYLGLAGGVVEELGDFEWTDADGAFTWKQVATNFEGFGKGVGEKVDAFRTTHKDLLIKDQVKAGNKSLARKVKDATGAIKNLDDEIAKANAEVDTQWAALREAEIQALKARIKEVETQIAQSSSTEKKALEDKKLTFQEELSQAYTERLQAAKVRLESELANQTAQLEAKDAARKKALKEQVDALTEKKKTAQTKIDGLEKKQKERETKLTDAFNAMEGVGDGIANIGAGVSKIFAKVDKENPKLKALLENIETSKVFSDELKRDFKAFKADMDAINEKKGVAVLTLLNVQQRIAQTTAAISTGLADLSALGKQRTSLDGVLGIETRQYLSGMQERSKDRLNAYLYEFVKSYQYQYLHDVSDTFYNFDTWVDKLRKLETVNVDGTVNTVTLAQFQTIEQEVITSEYLQMARNIVRERQTRAGMFKNTYVCTLSAAQRASLLKDGFLQFSLLDDFNTNAHLAMRDARIMDIDLKQFDVALAEGVTSLNLHVDFEHSGTSIILDGEGKYWFFQCGEGDDPIRWRFVWKYAPWIEDLKDPTNHQKIEKDAQIEEDEFLDKALGLEAIKYREYMPSLFSPITLWLNKQSGEAQRTKGVAALNAVAFEVTFVHR